MRLPSKDSAFAKAVRVFIYVLIPFALAFLQNPDAVKAIVEYYPTFAVFVAVGTPVLAFVYNYFRSDVENY